MDFGERLKMCREKKGFSQKSVAEKIGVKNNTLSGYESARYEPSYDVLTKLADIYEVSLDYLLGRSSDPRLTQKQEDGINKEAQQWLDIINKLDEKDQAFFRSTMETFIKTHKKEQ